MLESRVNRIVNTLGNITGTKWGVHKIISLALTYCAHSTNGSVFSPSIARSLQQLRNAPKSHVGATF